MSNEKLKNILSDITADNDEAATGQEQKKDQILSELELQDIVGGIASCPTWSADDGN